MLGFETSKWFIPGPIKESQSPEIIKGWFKSENEYCSQKLSSYLFFFSLLYIVLIYLDINHTPPADIQYAVTGRGSISILALIFSFVMKYWNSKYEYKEFIIKKIVFASLIMIAVIYQLQYSIDFDNRSRAHPIFIAAIGLFCLRIGPHFTAIYIATNSVFVGFYILKEPSNLWSDVNNIIVLIVVGYILQSRILADAKFFVAEWKEKSILQSNEKRAISSMERAFNELIKLVYPHMVDQIREGKSLEQTMPVGKENCNVICLDIKDSSDIIHLKFPGQVEAFQASGYKRMCEGYIAEDMISTGYRIKDVGDGVYYSVGYPFSCPKQQSSSKVALEAALDLVYLFHKSMAEMEYPKPITCGVGISLGEVEGFFPNEGIKQYDLRGRAIILASRLESFRKSIHINPEIADLNDKNINEYSLLIIDRSTYYNLPTNLRTDLQKIDLKKNSLNIRNNEKAEEVYILKIHYLDFGTNQHKNTPISSSVA